MMKSLRIVSALALACFTVGQAEAQAYCALRAPVTTIGKMFPGCNHRSTTKTVGDDVRLAVSRRLPFNLHFDELGRHTVYFVTDPANYDSFEGIVHVRTEEGSMGLNEIAWAFDENLRVIDFRFQKTREKRKDIMVIESPPIRDRIIGSGYDELRALLSRNGESLAEGVEALAPEAKGLLTQVIHCGLKTMITTEEAWGADLWDLRVRATLGSGYWQLQTFSSRRIYSTPSMRAIEGAGSPDLDGAKVQAWKAVNDSTGAVQYVVRTPLRISGVSLQLLWVLDGDGRLVAITQHGGWGNAEVKSGFERLIGTLAQGVEDCASASELFFSEVSQIAKVLASS